VPSASYSASSSSSFAKSGRRTLSATARASVVFPLAGGPVTITIVLAPGIRR
jgi:hypothetical protein